MAWGYTIDWTNNYELYLQEKINEWGENSKLLNIKFFSKKSWELTFVNGILDDALLMGLSVVLVTTYSFFVLGGCSPVHFRGVSSLMGLLCVVLATLCGYSISFAAGL